MTDQTIDPVQLNEEMKKTKEAEELARRSEFARTNDGAIDPGIGNMGGAGATGSANPDIAANSTPLPGNSSDLPSQ